MHRAVMYLFFILAFIYPVCANAKEKLVVGVFDEHEVYLKTSVPYALGWKIFMLAAQKENIEIVPKPEAWARSLIALQAGEFVGVYGAMITPERRQWASFTLPLSYDAIRIFAQPDSDVESKEEILKTSQTVGVSKDSIQHEMAKVLNFSNIYAVVDRNALYKMLLAGRLDYLIYSETFINTYCFNFQQQKRSNCLKPIGKPLAIKGLHVMYMQSNATVRPLFARIDRQVNKMYQSGEIRTLFSAFEDGKTMYSTWEAFMKSADYKITTY